MPNVIKYTTGATETGCLRKGNMLIGNNTADYGATFWNGIDPPSGGYTIYLNKASGGPSIYCPANDTQLIAITNQISVSTNLIKNNNGGNFADGTLAPFNGSYGTLPTVVDITNDKPYNGSTSTKAAKFVAGGGMLISTDPSPFIMTVGVTYTFSFWYRQTNSNQFYIGFNNQGGSGDMNGNFQAYSAYGYFSNPTQTWQRCSWTFTNVVNKPYFFIYSTNSDAGSECLMTEFTLTEGSMPSGPGLTTAGNCLNWFATQTDKIVVNMNYEGIVTNGLVLNLDAGFSPSFASIPSNANNSTVTPWYDLSGNTNNGTLTNGPTFNSANSGSIVFDGVDDCVLIPFNNVLVTNTVTVNMWCYANTLNVYRTPFTSEPGLGAGLNGYGFRQRTDNTWWWVIGYEGNGAVVSTTLDQNQWVNLIGTYDGTTLNLYKNGSSVGSANGGGRTVNFTSPSINGYIRIGSLTSGNDFFSGKIAVLSIYNRALSAAEALQNYNAQKGRFGL